MLKQLKGMRYQLMRSELYIIYFSILIVTLILFFTYSVIQPDWLTVEAIFFTLIVTVAVMTPVGLYVIYKKTKDYKDRIQTFSIFLTALSEGKYGAKLRINDDHVVYDELDAFAIELNDLADKMKNQVNTLQRLADEKAEFAQQAHIAATIEERQRLARDLHDAVSQQLFALRMVSQATEKIIEKNPQVAKEKIKEIAEMALQAQNEMRALLLHLRPIYLSGETLKEGLIRLIDDLKKKCTLRFDVEIDEEIKLSQSKEEHIFRLIQEALSNILRHANAANVHLLMKNRENELFVHINDDGIGFDLETKLNKRTSYGLKTMRERCEEIGGTFKIRSKKGEGTYIDVRIPK